jgi:heme exporter protein A
MDPIDLRAENLHLWRGERHVLRGVHFEARGGEVVQITGGNGAGKTTLLRALCGLAHIEEGRVLWGGRDVREDRAGFHAALVYLGHDPPLKPDLTGRENLRFWIGVRRPLQAGEFDAALERTSAQTFSDRPVRTLSAGQKRRVALAGLLLARAPLWMLDEPTTNLDTDGQQLVSHLVAEHAEQGGLAVAAVHQGLVLDSARLRRLELAA